MLRRIGIADCIETVMMSVVLFRRRIVKAVRLVVIRPRLLGFACYLP